MIVKEPTNMIPNPIEKHRQLALTIYRLAFGCLFNVLKDLFGVSQSLPTEYFNKVVKVMVRCLYGKFVKTLQTEEEWVNQCKSFMENYDFSCVGAWDGFHVHGSTHLKNNFSFKCKYTITSMGLIGHNKRFLYLTTGVPGSIHNARLQRHSTLFQEIGRGNIIPSKSINLRDAGEIPLVTIGDSASPRLIKSFTKNTRDQKELYFDKKLCCA